MHRISALVLLCALVCRLDAEPRFGIGARYESSEASAVLRTNPRAAWSLDAVLLEGTLTVPSISVAATMLDPKLRIAGGRADFALTDRDGTLFQSRGTLASIGAEVTLKPCRRCATYVTAEAAYSAAIDEGDAFIGEAGGISLDRYRSHETSVRIGRRFFRDRFGMGFGARRSRVDADLSIFVEDRPVALPSLSADHVEPFGGFDYKIGPWLDGDIRFTPDSFVVRFSLNFVQGFWFDSECGTPGGVPCSAPRFCDFPMSAACGSNGLAGTCIERPAKCPSTTSWVCGCDGKDYANACLAQQAGVSVVNNERCPQPQDPCERGTHSIADGGFESGSIGAWNTDYGVVQTAGVQWDKKNEDHPPEQLVTAASPLMRLQGRPIKPYCGATMLRINDLEGNYHATRAWQTFHLPATVSACSYIRVHWGAMLHDGGHAPEDQPFFEIELLRNGNVISRERFTATAGQKGGWVDIRPSGEKDAIWYRHAEATASLSKAHPGDHMEIRMSVADCTQGHHGAAAFLDCVEIVDHCRTGCAFRGQGSLDAVVVPNIFTPNNDDINDIWAITAVPACRVTAQIFNAWGALMAEPSWDSEHGSPWEGYIALWNGKAKNGLDASDGTYYYILKVTNCFETRDFTGFFHLVRGKK